MPKPSLIVTDNNNLDPVWHQPLQLPSLNSDQVHLWRAGLERTEGEIEALSTLLSADEFERANRFRFAQHRRRFIVARGILRHLLGGYLKTNPQSLIFAYGAQGKPLLAQTQQDSILQFNLSHSQEHVLLGFTLNHPLGVDLEYQRPMPDALKIARRFFSFGESKMLEETKIEQQAQLFFQLWTAKEACLKAVGTGLADSLASVEFTFDHSNSLSLQTVRADLGMTADWSLFSFVPFSNYSAAIAINAPILKQNINYWHWHSNLSIAVNHNFYP